jgi:ATP-dependent protease ClpP protease subunit
VYLTKEERKKIRRQRRRAAWLEQQEMIRMGLVDAPGVHITIASYTGVIA